MSLFKRGYKVAKEDGLMSFLSESLDYLYWECKEKRWRISSSAKISIQGVEAEFGTSGRAPSSLRVFEKGEREMLSDVLKEISIDDVFWDIGANIGYYSCFIGQQAKVAAFEPSPIAAEHCRDNLSRNDIEASVYEYALSDSRETITLHPGRIARAENEPVEVEKKRGDKIAEDLSLPTVVKIDVEGAEVEVINGMEDILSSDKCRLLYCEVHTEKKEDRKAVSDYGENLETFNNKINELGFEVEILSRRGNEVHIKGKKN
ncbi:FkbM family methyltransferase [Natrinema zhouii]|uniref:FkbM family methyltransferase n=1 Tax=Natrinema zhouii TaxID=1710539 RepID=A0A7D6CQ93_9EURY|nr:FkbM family methyltransferase [Natrinema zhouii]QLK27472.1 FkbM family methyltransferase [Natrinema zhouii]